MMTKIERIMSKVNAQSTGARFVRSTSGRSFRIVQPRGVGRFRRR